MTIYLNAKNSETALSNFLMQQPFSTEICKEYTIVIHLRAVKSTVSIAWSDSDSIWNNK